MNDRQASDFLEALVRIPSVSGAEHAAARFFVAYASRLGFAAHVDEVGNAIATIGGAGPRVVLLGHIDTVPGEVPVRREGDRLFGRGTVDAKGALATFLAAASRAHQQGSLAHRVEVVACVEEEVTSSKGARFRATQPAPDLCIVGEPSGWERVTIGYKGFVSAHFSRQAPLAHTAGKEAGLASLACRAWVELEEAARRSSPADASLFEQLLTHLASIDHAADGLYETVRLEVKLRLPPGWSVDETGSWLRGLLPDWHVELLGGVPAWSTVRTDPLARSLARSIRKTGGRAGHVRKTGTADTNVLAPAWGCPMVAYGPGDSALDHTPTEHIDLRELARSIAVLTDLLSGSSAPPTTSTKGQEALTQA